MSLQELSDSIPDDLKVATDQIPPAIACILRYVAHRDAPQATPAGRKVT
jgi:hypothetical protein